MQVPLLRAGAVATVFAELPGATRLNTVRGGAEPGAVEEEHLPRAIEWMAEWQVDYVAPVASGRPGQRGAERFLQERGYEQSAVNRKYVRAATRTEQPRIPGLPRPRLQHRPAGPRLRDAAPAGCHTVAAEVCTDAPGPTPAAARNLRRFGFVEAYRTVGWQLPVQPQSEEDDEGEGGEPGSGLWLDLPWE